MAKTRMGGRARTGLTPGAEHEHEWRLDGPTVGALTTVRAKSRCECGGVMVEERSEPTLQLIRRYVSEADGATRYYRKAANGNRVLRCSESEFDFGIDPAGRY